MLLSPVPTKGLLDAQALLEKTPQQPGVYQMFAQDGRILYVGKARQLKQRLASYFRTQGLSAKTQALVKRIARVETTVTHTETEALLLEQNLIKALKPPFNILLRDDKSYPFLHLSDHPFPALRLQRARHQRGPGEWFGPYPSRQAVSESLALLYPLFRLRQCDDIAFNHRSRPCLQYQMKRCSAPCTGEISAAAYAEAVEHARLFIQGKSQEVTQQLAAKMEAAAAQWDFEKAAYCRDQIQQVRQLQAQQDVDTGVGDVDVFALDQASGHTGLSFLQIRQGRLMGSRHFHFKNPLEASASETLTDFLAQFFLTRTEEAPAADILVSHPLEDAPTLMAALAEKFAIKAPRCAHLLRGQRARWLALAKTNAQQQRLSHQNRQEQHRQRLDDLQRLLQLEHPLERLEGFDISHTQGEATTASCVVFDQQGPAKQDYRRFHITGITPGDDSAAMRQALTRRCQQLQKDQTPLPDLWVFDGGQGQLQAARETLQQLGLLQVPLLAIAKGPSRKAGLETLYFNTPDQVLQPPQHQPALHLLQALRDEAHRFALSGHRRRRGKNQQASSLEAIKGIGPKRRQALLRHFGGRQALLEASVEALCQVQGIDRVLAQALYAQLHPSEAV